MFRRVRSNHLRKPYALRTRNAVFALDQFVGEVEQPQELVWSPQVCAKGENVPERVRGWIENVTGVSLRPCGLQSGSFKSLERA